MGKRKTDDERLAELHRLADDADPETCADTLRGALGARSNHVVAKAATLIGPSGSRALVPELLAAYERLLVDPLKHDPTCAGKTAIVDALVQLEFDDFDFYAAAVQYRQLEPVWGGSEDRAAHLRGTSAIGLVGCGSPLRVLTELTELLVDPCKPARIGAVRALGQVSREAAPLLRLKILIGDREAEVLGECCAALLNVERAAAIGFVARLLEADDTDLREEAVLALGESRLPEAFTPLRDCWLANRGSPAQRTLLTAISLLRLPEGNDFLLALIREGSRGALDAVRALAWYRDVPAIHAQIEQAVRDSQDPKALELFRSEF